MQGSIHFFSFYDNSLGKKVKSVDLILDLLKGVME